VTLTTPAVDGRRLRRAQNREAVLDALVSLFADGVFDPTTDAIAERAGISARSLFRYFDDVDDLRRSAVDHVMARARPLLDHGVPLDAPLADRIAGLVAARTRLFETSGPGARAGRLGAYRNPTTAARLHETQTLLRRQVAELFAPELTGPRAAHRPAVVVLCAFETYELMRFEQGLSRAKTVASLVAALTALLGAPLGGPQ
jgi:AcrR family transcriptional regulator